MAIISMFYWLIISMFYGDNKQHHLPHIHVKYQGDEAIFSIPDGKLIEGGLPSKRIQSVRIILHEEELMADWELAVNHQNIFRIDSLK
jgi:hypothetical protein